MLWKVLAGRRSVTARRVAVLGAVPTTEDATTCVVETGAEVYFWIVSCLCFLPAGDGATTIADLKVVADTDPETPIHCDYRGCAAG